MTVFAAVLFSHIAGAFFLFAGLSLEWLGVSYLRKSLDRAHADPWIDLVRIAPRFYEPAIGVVFFSGRYLASKVGWDQTWIIAALIALVVIGLVGAVFTRPRIRAILKTAKETPYKLSACLERLLHDPVLLASVRFRVALVFGILLLMVTKLDGMFPLMVISGAVALGTLMAGLAWRRPTLQQATTAN
jgi:hypothetical protein